jgi:Ca2+/Na+ antiporter
MARAYERAVASRWFAPALVVLFVAYAFVFLLLFGLALAAATVATAADALTFALDLFALQGHYAVQIGLLVSSLAAAALIVVGLVALPRDRARAYLWFKRSVLVSLLVGQVFLFYTQQFGALVELVLNLIALGGLNALLTAERHAQRRAERQKDVAEGAPGA